MSTQDSNNLIASLDNPFAENDEQDFKVPGQSRIYPRRL